MQQDYVLKFDISPKNQPLLKLFASYAATPNPRALDADNMRLSRRMTPAMVQARRAAIEMMSNILAKAKSIQRTRNNATGVTWIVNFDFLSGADVINAGAAMKKSLPSETPEAERVRLKTSIGESVVYYAKAKLPASNTLQPPNAALTPA